MEAETVKARQAAMRICANAPRGELEALVSDLVSDETVSDLRPTEKGLVMLRGRIGGEGAPFNVGEASVSRAAVSLSDGTAGFAYHLGRDGQKARAAAILDALWQRPTTRSQVEKGLAPIAERLAAKAKREAEHTAATRVEFFTMTRGDN
ncbi:phosphonate C-P lyase system protein PhnG [Mesorhizobium liriopis]|nr:phosphonate C-P lyase system protein PhnG [Mesorhizobium liriopis]